MNQLRLTFPHREARAAMAPLPREEGECFLVVDSRSGEETDVLAAYRKWGTACASHLSGDYAFVLWDEQQQHLLAARSITGRGPLYVAQMPSGGIMCASDPLALLA